MGFLWDLGSECSVKELILIPLLQSGRMVFFIFAAISEFERKLNRERTIAGLQAVRARGQKGGRKFQLTKAQVILAQASMKNRDTSVAELCKELGITRP